MKYYAKIILLFSFFSLLAVFAFGLLRTIGPIKAGLDAHEVAYNIQLFHSHFDQLCWLGAAAVGLVFFTFAGTYRGSMMPVQLFTWLYIFGTTIFSLAFLLRALGEAFSLEVLVHPIFAIMVSLGGLSFILLIVSGLKIFFSLRPVAFRATGE